MPYSGRICLGKVYRIWVGGDIGGVLGVPKEKIRVENQALLIEQLRLLEERLQEPEVRKSLKELEILLADDFVEFGSSGRMYNKQQVIDELVISSTAQMTIMDFEVKLLAPGVALATYRVIKLNKQGEGTNYSLRSSIWKLNKGRWQMVFHQGTPSMTP